MPSQEILDEAYPVIDRLAKSRSIRGSFAYYERADVSQEVWCMCLEALERYDRNRGPVENYLVTHVTNRLKNLKRDRYFRPGSDMASSGNAITRMNLVNALSLSTGNINGRGVLLCGTAMNVDPIDYVLSEETLIYIKSRLPDDLLDVFEDILGNNKIRSPLVELVRRKINEILSERDDDVGD